MRKVGISILVLLLVGCQSISKNQSEQALDAIEEVNQSNIVISNNYVKPLFSYHLPQNIGLIESNQISSRLRVENVDVVMSLDVSQILSDEEKLINVDNLVVDESFSIKGRKESLSGHIYLEQLEAGNYLLYMKVSNVFFLAVVSDIEFINVVKQIVMVARTVDVKEKKVVSTFSNKETISYEKEVIELFSESIPDEGMIKDIIVEEEDE